MSRFIINNITFVMSKIRKVYNLRKTSNIKQSLPPEESRISELKEEIDWPVKGGEIIEKNVSILSQNVREFQAKIMEELQEKYEVQGEELVINKLQLNFCVPLNDIEKKDVKIKNIGNSAVYVQFNFKNNPKINANGFKDTKLKFNCHYENTVIKPGEEVTFIFSFLSEFSGNFTQDVQISCQPTLKTKIPNLKLNGKAYIKDQWLSNRQKFNQKIEQTILRSQVEQILRDVVNEVRLPPPPLPDVRDMKVAQREFEIKNAGLNLYFNEYLHNWFNELFHQICDKENIPKEDRYWDQSVSSLHAIIERSNSLDDVDKKCFRDRVYHYCYLSSTPLPNKSELYQTVYEFVSTAAYSLGGEYVDAVRKELDMWEVPFKEPLGTETPEELKARKEEIDKIKTEWIKRTKKKKWGEEQQKEMVNEFKKRASLKTAQNVLNRFTNFEQSAQFIKARQFLKKSSFSLQQYHRYLERIKTVRECPLDGKKVMIKWHLQLKDNCQDKLKQLEEYLTKKKQLEKRLEEEKKEGAKKKKAPPKIKKKGQKQEEEQKPLVFDFMSILDEENWNGFTETFRVVLEKQPFLVLIGITYGPRSGRYLSQYSVNFILEHLKTLQSSIEFYPHDQLPNLRQKIENQTIGQGSILLMQNLNFLPWEVAQEEIVEIVEGQPPKISKRKLLQPQIGEFFDDLGQSIDFLVNEDRFLQKLSGFSAYLNRQVIMGTLWWRYVGLSMRVTDSTLIFGQDLTPQNYVLLSRLCGVVRQIHLVGKVGVKFYIVRNGLEQLGDIVLGQSEKKAILNLIEQFESNQILHKLKLPSDFVLRRGVGEQTQTLLFNGSQTDLQGFKVIDVGHQTIEQINQINQGHLFLLGQTSVQRNIDHLSESLSKILKLLFKKQQMKRQRHAYQASTPAGIDYTEDLIIYLIGLAENLVEKVQLRDKKIQMVESQAEQAEQQQQQGESDKKKMQLVSDYRLSSLSCLQRLWNGRFDVGLKDLSKYELIMDS